MTDPFSDPTPPPAAAPPERTPLHDIMWLLEWARTRGYKIGPVLKYQGVEMQVEDLRQPKIEGGRGEVEGNIWAEHGHEEGG